MNSKAGFDPPFLYAKSFLLLPFTRFRCDELIDITILGSRLVNGSTLLPILMMPCPSLALRRNSSCGLDSPYRRCVFVKKRYN